MNDKVDDEAWIKFRILELACARNLFRSDNTIIEKAKVMERYVFDRKDADVLKLVDKQ